MAFWSADATRNIRRSLSGQAQENFSRDKLMLAVYVFCGLSILGQASLILVSWSKLPPQVPLFYSRPWGEAMLAPTAGLWILPGLLLLIASINFFIISNFSQNRFLARAIVVFTLLVAFLTIYDSAKIIALLT
ncbi:hypothetical protein HYW40_00575 [Candidatus Curtissbacteria bacterium]|nr:hypothetical protein [Candidatus Curtissbacteria bacterium]